MSEKKYWVTMTDKMLSGWGEAKARISKYVVECDNMQQAEQIERNAKARSDMKNVNICTAKPSYPAKKYRTDYIHYNDLSGVWKK